MSRSWAEFLSEELEKSGLDKAAIVAEGISRGALDRHLKGETEPRTQALRVYAFVFGYEDWRLMNNIRMGRSKAAQQDSDQTLVQAIKRTADLLTDSASFEELAAFFAERSKSRATKKKPEPGR